MRTYHLCVNIENALKKQTLSFFEDDKGEIMSTKEVKKILREEQSKGRKYFTGCVSIPKRVSETLNRFQLILFDWLSLFQSLKGFRRL